MPWKCPAVSIGQRFCAAGLCDFSLLAGTVRAQDAELSRKLTLKEAVSLAVANSRDLALARLQYGVMQRQIGVARSVFLPNLYTGTGVAYTNGFPLLRGGGAPAIFTLSYTQQIFNPPLKGEQHAAEAKGRGAAAFDGRCAGHGDGRARRWIIWNSRKCGTRWN